MRLIWIEIGLLILAFSNATYAIQANHKTKTEIAPANANTKNQPVQLTDQNWRLIYSRNHIHLYRGDKNDYGIHQFKLTATAKGTVAKAVAQLSDTKKACAWLARCKSASLLSSKQLSSKMSTSKQLPSKRLSNKKLASEKQGKVTKDKVMIELNMPWPVTDRLLITESWLTQKEHSVDLIIRDLPQLDWSTLNNPQLNALTQSIQSEDIIAVPYFQAQYQINQIDVDKIDLTYQVSMASGGQLPNWATDRVLPKDLINSIHALLNAIAQSE